MYGGTFFLRLVERLSQANIYIEWILNKRDLGGLTIPEALFIIFNLEKASIIERLPLNKKEDIKSCNINLFDQIKYFHYKIYPNYYEEIRHNENYRNELINYLIDLLNNDQILKQP